jgi:hypothetical protein
MPRRVLTALSEVPTFDMFRYDNHMYRRQPSGQAYQPHPEILATPAYREPGLKPVHLTPDTKVEWVRPQ